ncbi:PREDICTED: putative ATP-dependent RNA helicase TDRD9 [Vollenhovia emeryi]|uniref:putative ATP-dependent RNA helicase TDRD9 n=1 Tax=Vollenhovia emeryi TaxID=411798 RepID=UPI0005F40A73|nr:PREDICTED: putative ATP-dependent RNA helicase TDRD9 [Vollenhovia emeryi]XP_011867556.1 PREDICTED: putative ATP-dependent RNA helicase TDRD9 [Vollenhovia emeryi]XP_011867557.1 PREDICTED: putative ATP-dependent RNA helicase TDRD9 [Vollenhovia emeryi]XP_011867558.1 PREDICTED: putative ATP-dependent RNA helicase TDRD9 [Vollenhovia emeryi]
MDPSLVDRILNMHKSCEPFSIPVPPPTVRKRESSVELYEDSRPQADECIESETDYIKEYIRKDDEEYIKIKNSIFLDNDHMDEVSEVSGETIVRKENTMRLYRMFNFAYRPNVNLPILSMKHKVVSMIASNSVVIIRGSTGCGKTTQVPQLILDAEFEKKQHCNIIVTQPRRIAALSIAKRVSEERDWPVGTIVGYQMGLIRNISQDTRITYCTTGVLLNKLTNKKHLMDYTHIILDEVHERDEDMDFLLLVIRKLLRTNSTMVKIILMSATIDVDRFSAYFSTPVENQLLPAPIIEIVKGGLYDVSVYYLNEMDNLGNIPEVDREPKFTLAMAEFSARIIHVFDSIDKKNSDTSNEYERSTVLMFLPGYGEIEELRTVLLSPKYADTNWDIIILHSLISTEEQENIFKKPPPNSRRLILSTNIAESSITVPNVKYVIDFCLTKLLVTEPGTNYQCLELCWASKSQCQQRAGRTGRVMDGRVYRMVPREFYEKVLQEEAVPEMLRAPLANVILKTKLLGMGEPKALLALSLDPPNLSNIRNTVLLLKEVGALLNRSGQELDGDMTPLGRVMANCPLDVRVTKLIVLGHLFGVLSDAIIIAASMAVKDIFNIGFFELESTYHEKLHWSANSDSDCIACLNAFKVWRNDKAHRRINSPFEEKEWARRKSLRVRSLREMDAFIFEITQKLHDFGITEIMSSDTNTWEALNIDRTFVLKFIIAGAFYPNYFVKFPHKVKEHEQAIERTLASRDPSNTIFLHGWPLRQPGSLYSKKFQEIFGNRMKLKNYENITVSFDGSSRVYVEYEAKNRAPADNTFVRDCVKMRHCRNPIEIDLLSETDARCQAEDLGLTKDYGRILFQPSNPGEPPCRRYMYDKKPYPDLPEYSGYRSKVRLQGPFSPIEIQLAHIVINGITKTVSVESTSVNSVLLDSCPDNPNGLFLVAQNIVRDSKNPSHLVLRNTTLLPITPGLTSLIALIFAPYMELRRSPLGTYYTGALCGLGYNRITEKSLFPEHDLEILFDVEFTISDLRMINKLRHWMNLAMNFNHRSDIVDDEAHHEMTANCHSVIRNTFKNVIYKTREKIEPVPVSNFDKWNRYDETLFLVPARETSRNTIVYSLHKALELNEKNDELEDMIKHLLELETLAYQDPRETSIASVCCKLCQTEVTGIINLRAHLCSAEHAAKQQLIDTTAEFGEALQSLLDKLRL